MSEKTYRIQNLSCANCAKTYEENLNRLNSVEEAKVDFNSAKIYITGDATIEELEQAGAFDNIKVRDVQDLTVTHEKFWKKKENYPVYISALLLIVTVLTSYFSEQDSHLFTIGYMLSIIIGGYSLFIAGFKNLVRLKFDMNTLMTIAVIGASLIGEWFEAATVVILFAVSEALERYSMDKARTSIKHLMELAPSEAIIVKDGIEVIKDVKDILVGDVMRVKPGQKFAMDGTVIKGSSTVNQASITGESKSVDKVNGDEVFAGTLNEEGVLEVEVTKLIEDTELSKVIHLVEKAQSERASSEALVDRFAKYYTPIIILISLLVMFAPPLLFNTPWHDSLYQGLAVLIIGCPCALVISTPVAIVTAIGNAARHGVLIKGGIYLEETARIDAIAFDKTGTLTIGQPVVTDLVTFEDNALIKAAALEKNSQHPIAVAILNEADKEHLDYRNLEINDFQSITGKGVKGVIDNETYYIGSPKLFKELGFEIDDTVSQLQTEGKTVIICGSDKIEVIIGVADDLRSESISVLDDLKSLNIKTMMLTGDNHKTAQIIGDKCHIDEVKAELMPADKLKIINEEQKRQKIMMVGDGVNDAPALASANVGIAMGAGTDTALETADIALMSDNLNKIPYIIRLSKKTLTIIKQNITFSLGIKLIALLLVIPGWLTLWIAIFSDIGATLIVTLNSMRLMKKRRLNISE